MSSLAAEVDDACLTVVTSSKLLLLFLVLLPSIDVVITNSPLYNNTRLHRLAEHPYERVTPVVTVWSLLLAQRPPLALWQGNAAINYPFLMRLEKTEVDGKAVRKAQISKAANIVWYCEKSIKWLTDAAG